jgi:hypothetical protein
MVADCTFLVLGEGDMSFLFVQRETGLKLLGIDATGSAACTTAAPPAGSPSADPRWRAGDSTFDPRP